jgi:hypothetical protein
VKSTRQPFSTSARPRAAAKCDFPAPGEGDQIGAFLQPAVAGGERPDLRLADHRHSVEVEGLERLADRQPGLAEMTLDAAAAALGHLVLGESGEEAGGGPALLVRLRGDIGPDELDGGQSQLGQEQFDPRGVNGIARLHAASPRPTVPPTVPSSS